MSRPVPWRLTVLRVGATVGRVTLSIGRPIQGQ